MLIWDLFILGLERNKSRCVWFKAYVVRRMWLFETTYHVCAYVGLILFLVLIAYFISSHELISFLFISVPNSPTRGVIVLCPFVVFGSTRHPGRVLVCACSRLNHTQKGIGFALGPTTLQGCRVMPYFRSTKSSIKGVCLSAVTAYPKGVFSCFSWRSRTYTVAHVNM